MVSKCPICGKNTMEHNIKKCKKQHNRAQINREQDTHQYRESGSSPTAECVKLACNADGNTCWIPKTFLLYPPQEEKRLYWTTPSKITVNNLGIKKLYAYLLFNFVLSIEPYL
jgi:hypothetical protein